MAYHPPKRPPPTGPQYEVVVGNIGTVHRGRIASRAVATHAEYVARSMLPYGRASGEPVTILKDGEHILEYTPPPEDAAREPV